MPLRTMPTEADKTALSRDQRDRVLAALDAPKRTFPPYLPARGALSDLIHEKASQPNKGELPTRAEVEAWLNGPVAGGREFCERYVRWLKEGEALLAEGQEGFAALTRGVTALGCMPRLVGEFDSGPTLTILGWTVMNRAHQFVGAFETMVNRVLGTPDRELILAKLQEFEAGRGGTGYER